MNKENKNSLETILEDKEATNALYKQLTGGPLQDIEVKGLKVKIKIPSHIPNSANTFAGRFKRMLGFGY